MKKKLKIYTIKDIQPGCWIGIPISYILQQLYRITGISDDMVHLESGRSISLGECLEKINSRTYGFLFENEYMPKSPEIALSKNDFGIDKLLDKYKKEFDKQSNFKSNNSRLIDMAKAKQRMLSKIINDLKKLKH